MHAAYNVSGAGDWPDEHSDDFSELLQACCDDPEKAFAYVVLSAYRSDDAGFVRLMACSVLEDILEKPLSDLIDRIVAEALVSPRLRWMLSNPYKVAVSDDVWVAIEHLRITGPHEETTDETYSEGA